MWKLCLQKKILDQKHWKLAYCIWHLLWCEKCSTNSSSASFSLNLSLYIDVQRIQFKGIKKKKSLKRTIVFPFLWVRTYAVLFIFERDLKGLHGADHGLHGGEDVLVNKTNEAPLVFIWVTSTMNDPHLFDEGAFATFSRTLKGHKTQKQTSNQEQNLVRLQGQKRRGWTVHTRPNHQLDSFICK